ncbi:hypothetical protein SASPL_142078 [Salvia splendens]|uniref:3-beta hydroxysteroid dehydrogenase/isomerase domain-containing protein n=1 Tax=Salvia splendens TaxID=180675 RepID=A0A8X8WKA4_SALSN|nr:cinnamoyl-CoA reductase-like SNL6 [Salvia splendens]KAG6395944.1 hypothetical protein SASPL_142078 [Salvia splendens]
MGIVRQEAEVEEFRRMLSCAAVSRRKAGDGYDGATVTSFPGDAMDRMVCVTSGVSYLGIAIVNRLLLNGYSVRIIVDNEEDVEKLREMETSGEMRLNNSVVEVVMARLSEVESLTEAFDGCRGVFHTAAFVDPAGLSGYSKAMAEIEVNMSKNVVRACGLSPSVRHCVLTSSLVACIWRDSSAPRVIDHKCWSDEAICVNKKLWYALGKLRAEKAAWEIAKAKASGVKLATICPGLITGLDFYRRNPTPTVAYLKGVEEMYAHGLLATVSIDTLAKAHVRVFEEMTKEASGSRYICFDNVMERGDEVERLAAQTGLSVASLTGGASSSSRPRYELSNAKLSRLMLRPCRCEIGL